MAVTIAPTLPIPNSPYSQEKTEKEDKKAPDKKKQQKPTDQKQQPLTQKTSQDSPMSHNDRSNLPTDQGLHDHQMGPSTDSDINTVMP